MSKARQLAIAHAGITALAPNSAALTGLAGKETILPIGTISYFPTVSIPTGWLIADGSAISRSTYSALFAKVGTTYGVGDGSTTFNIPDGRGRSLIGAGQGSGLTNRALATTGGAETHQLGSTEMPAHTHRVYGTTAGGSGTTASAAHTSVRGLAGSSDATGAGYITNGVASGAQLLENTGSGGAHNNMQPFLSVNMCIYAGA